MLKQTNVTYLTRGAASLDDIPGVSTDFFWPQAKFKQVPHDDFPDLLHLLQRSMRLQNIGVYRIDILDYLSSELNSLGFSQKPWESQTFLNRGFYINWFYSDAGAIRLWRIRRKDLRRKLLADYEVLLQLH